MIIIGYQGIGKSTLAGKNNCIDLESGNFWFQDGVTQKQTRHDNWYVTYCNIANHLSEQGYTVFTSSHKVVREELKKSKEKVWIVCPSLDLEYEWITKLNKRYEQTKSEKDYKTLKNAVGSYTENITELLEYDLPTCEITSMDYDLADIVRLLKL